MAAVTICGDLGTQESKVCHCFHCFPSIFHEVMGCMALEQWLHGTGEAVRRYPMSKGKGEAPARQ